MEIKATILVTAVLLLSACATSPTTTSIKQQQQQFIQNVSRHNNISPTEIKTILSHAKYSPSVISKITTPYETKPYDIYRQHFLTARRIDQGAQFWQEHQDILALAQKKYGVDPGIIVAILGVETHYGEHEGNYRALDALYTLSFFYPQRAAFFSKELAQYLVLCDQQHLSADDVQGSYAGALGMPQFMPSSYRNYGVDFTGNHHIDLMRNTDDVIMSVANYLAHAGWQRSQPIAAPLNPSYLARVKPYVNTKANLVIPVTALEKRGVPLLNYSAAAKPQNVSVLMFNDSTSHEYWLVFANFRSILKYNTSPNYALAVYELSKAIQENMHNTHLERAQQHYASGQLQEAIASYELALQEDPDSVDILHAIGVIKAQLNQFDDALIFIDNVLKKDKNNPRILNSKANILARQQNWDDAIRTYRHALEIDPHYVVAYTGLGNCLYQQNDLNAAEQALQHAIKLNPQFIEAQYNYALVLAKKERWPEAIALLEPIVAKHPNFSAALGQLGELYLQTNEPLRALTLLDRRAELEPENSQALHSLAQALALTDHLEESIHYYENTLMHDPHHLEVNHNLANAYVKLGDTNKALNYYFRQLSVQPLPESYFNIGVLMMYQERNKEAIEYFDQAGMLDPANTAVWLNLGSIYLKQQRYDKALETYQRVLTHEPHNDEIQYIVNALNNDVTPARAPNDYLRNLFNHYADHYDQHLTQYLHYTVPQQLTQLLVNELGYAPQAWRIVDLGCGTGLSGQAVKPFARELIGIDISEQMIEVAHKKACYDTLVVGDIEQKVLDYHDVDLIVAADVFSYIGDLNTVYKACHTALKAHGIVLFSVERATTGNFRLQKNMRYAHSKEYIESLAKEYHFDVLRCDNTILRKQQKQPVEGFLVMLRSNS